jgi:hypothetical protein
LNTNTLISLFNNFLTEIKHWLAKTAEPTKALLDLLLGYPIWREALFREGDWGKIALQGDKKGKKRIAGL